MWREVLRARSYEAAHVFLARRAGQPLRRPAAVGAPRAGGELLLRQRLGGHGCEAVTVAKLNVDPVGACENAGAMVAERSAGAAARPFTPRVCLSVWLGRLLPLLRSTP
jgi:hypothetical protein